MWRRIITYLIVTLTKMIYEKFTVDKINKKLVEPIPGLPGYYRFLSTADMPQGRFVHYLHLVKRLSMNVDEDLLKRYLTVFQEAFKKHDEERFNGAMFLLKDTLHNVTPVETYYWLAALMYFTKDEDLSTFDYDINKKKVEYFKSLPNQSFFLASLLKSLKSSGDQSLEEIETYLMDSQVKAESYERILTEISKQKS